MQQDFEQIRDIEYNQKHNQTNPDYDTDHNLDCNNHSQNNIITTINYPDDFGPSFWLSDCEYMAAILSYQ